MDKEASGSRSRIRAVQGCGKRKMKISLNCGVFKEKKEGVPLSKLRDLIKFTPYIDLTSAVSSPSYTKQGFGVDCIRKGVSGYKVVSSARVQTVFFVFCFNCTSMQ